MEQARWGQLSAASQEVRSAIAGVREELGIPDSYPPEVLAQAADAANRRPNPADYVDRRDLPFVTIDPASSLDLDQAVYIEKRLNDEGRQVGYRVYYAIADVAFFVDPGTPLDAEVNERGLTAYGPDQRFGLHPPALSENAASLLPDQDRPAALWTINLNNKGKIVKAKVQRAIVRSRAKLSYDQVQNFLDHGDTSAGAGDTTPIPDAAHDSLKLLKEVGLLRQAVERKRGGVSMEVPDQEIEEDVDGDFNLLYRKTLPVEGWNAQISLLTGMAAAKMMSDEGVGILRTLPPASPQDLRRMRATARALGLDWPKKQNYAEFLRTLDSSNPKAAAFMSRATTLFKGAGYLAFDHQGNMNREELASVDEQGGVGVGEHEQLTIAASSGTNLNTERRHSAIAAEYAHVTAPLRRLVDRYGTEICLAHTAHKPVPGWVLDKLPALPAEMAAAYRVSHKYERKCADVVEASLLENRIGEVFDGVVVDTVKRGPDKPILRGDVMLADPAVIARIDSPDGGAERQREAKPAPVPLVLGEPVKAKLVEVSVPDGRVRFEAVPSNSN